MLTKSWLMGVRRGWLSLMKPRIETYDDVERAFDKLLTFTENLREQVLNVRQVTEKEKAEALLDKLTKEIKEARYTARHWRNAYEGKTSFPNEDERRDGEYMLRRYQDNFEGVTERSKRKRGGHGLARPAPLTEFFDDVLKLLYAEASYLAGQAKHHEALGIGMAIADPVFREFDLHGMKIVVVDPKHHGLRIRAYVEYIERAYKDIKRKGFSVVWYGVLFLMSSDHEKLSKEEQAEYDRAGYKALESRAGTYHSGSDVVRITAPANDRLVRVIAHELGHRYWYKVMSKGERARFESLIEGDWSMLHALLLNHEKLNPSPVVFQGRTYMSEPLLFRALYDEVSQGADLSVEKKALVRRRFLDMRLDADALEYRAGVPLVSEYARSRPTEAFAEVFERYVAEDDLTRAQVESFRSVLPRGKGGGGAKVAKVAKNTKAARSKPKLGSGLAKNRRIR
jgi:hypothetical protein